MEVFTQTLLAELKQLPAERIGPWIHVDTSISKTISERGKLNARKVVGLVGQVVRSARLAARGFDAYYPISQTRIGLTRDILLLAPFRLASRRIVVHLHGGALDRFLRTQPQALTSLLRWLLGGPSSSGIVETPSLRHCLAPLLPPERIKVVRNTAFLPPEAAEKQFGDPLRVLYLSTLIETKGYRELVDAVVSLTNAGIQIELEVAGTPATEGDEQWLRSRPDCPKVRFLGSIAGEKKWHALRRAHVVALPTYYPLEGQPVAIVEGMACRCAILATRRPGILDMVGDHEGLLLEPQQGTALQRDLESALRTLAEHPNLVRSLADGARARFERELAPDRFMAAWLAAARPDA
jgi:glycosyltransferase involved in cell wall biosynthesis